MKRFIKQFSRHTIIGGTAFLIDYGLLIALTEHVGIHYLESATISFSISVIFNYFFSMRFVFERREDLSRGMEALVFFLLSVVGLILNNFLLLKMVDLMEIHYTIAKLLATFVVTIYNFGSRKYFLESNEAKGLAKQWLNTIINEN